MKKILATLLALVLITANAPVIFAGNGSSTPPSYEDRINSFNRNNGLDDETNVENIRTSIERPVVNTGNKNVTVSEPTYIEFEERSIEISFDEYDSNNPYKAYYTIETDGVGDPKIRIGVVDLGDKQVISVTNEEDRRGTYIAIYPLIQGKAEITVSNQNETVSDTLKIVVTGTETLKSDNSDRPTRPTVETGAGSGNESEITSPQKEINISGNNQSPERPIVDTTIDNKNEKIVEQYAPKSQVVISDGREVFVELPQAISIYFNGEKLDTKESEPVMNSGRVLVPVRFVLEKMGYRVSFDNDTQSVIAKDDIGNTLKMGIEEEFVMVNSLNYYVDVPAKLIGDRTMVPVRFVSEKLGADVQWDEKTKTVNITYNSSTISNFYNSTIHVVERESKLYAIPSYSYASGYYADATSAFRSVGGFNLPIGDSKMSGRIEVWNNHYPVHTLKMQYDLTKSINHEPNAIEVYSGTDVVGTISMVRANTDVYVKLTDVAKYSDFSLSQHFVKEYMLGESVNGSNRSNNEIISIQRYEVDRPSIEQIRFEIVWESKYQTDNFDISVKKVNASDNVDISCSEPVANYNEYSSIVHVNCKDNELKDIKLNIVVSVDGISKKIDDYYLSQARLKTIFEDEIIEKEKELEKNVNQLWEIIKGELQKQEEALYLNVFKDAYTINPDDGSDRSKAVKQFFGKKYYNYLSINNRFLDGSIDEMDIIGDIYGKITDGCIDINKKETIVYKDKEYTILVLGWGYDNVGNYEVIIDNTWRCRVDSNMSTIKARMYDYQTELKGLFDTAVQECISETTDVVGNEIMGLKNLKKISAAWIDEKFFGADVKNEFIDIALKGLTNETKLTKICEDVEDAVKSIGSAKKNSKVVECKNALKKVEDVSIILGSWKELLQ